MNRNDANKIRRANEKRKNLAKQDSSWFVRRSLERARTSEQERRRKLLQSMALSRMTNI